MARPRTHDTDLLLDAVVNIALQNGSAAVSVGAVTRATGAPSGTIYNRFGDRDGMLRAAWDRAARRSQEFFLAAATAAPSPRQAAEAAALSVLDFARSGSGDARLLVGVRRDDLLRDQDDAGDRREHDSLNAPIAAAIRSLAHQLTGETTRRAVEILTLATIDLPHGAVRRHLSAGNPVPESVAPALTAAVNAVLDNLERSKNE